MQTETGTNIEKKSIKKSFFELIRFALIALVVVIPIRLFAVEPFVVFGPSMFPTFENGDYLIIDKLSYKFGDPKRDDVVVFQYPNDPTKFFIKRIIGLPNETVDIKGNTITITNKDHATGFTLKEPYVKNTANSNIHLVLKEDEYFVMGDNRGASSDSRYWGALKRDLIAGRALVRLLPVKEIGVLPGSYERSE